MHSIRNVLASLLDSLRHPGVLLLAWAVVTIPAALVVLPALLLVHEKLARHPGARSTLDPALDPDLLRLGLDLPMTGAGLFVFVAFMFLAGGILRSVGLRRRTGFSEFLADCGRCFLRNMRVLGVGTLVSLVVFWGADVLERLVREQWWYGSDTGPIAVLGWQTRWLTREMLVEGLEWGFGLLFLGLLFVTKAAMARLCVDDRHSALAAFGRAMARCLRHPLRTALTVGLFAALWIAGSYLIGLGTAHFLEVQQELWVGLAFGQAFVLWSLLLVIAFFVAARRSMELDEPVVGELLRPVAVRVERGRSVGTADLRPRAFSLAIIGLVTSLSAQPPPPAPGADFFASRRQLVMDAVRERTAEDQHAVVLLRGAAGRDDMAAFTQDQDFYYLAGVVEPDVAVLLLPASSEEELLVAPFNRFTATWEGERLVPGEAAAARTGFASVGNVRRLPARLDELLAVAGDGRRPVLWTFLQPQPNATSTPSSASGGAERRARDPFDGRPSREAAFADRLRQRYEDLVIEDLTPILGTLRAVKAPIEIAQIEAASRAAVQGVAEAMKAAEPGVYEFQLAAAARYVFTRLGGGADAYAPIVGAGINGCVLHYSANSKRCEDGELVVMDYGPSVNGYCTDVTRTFPVNGKFTAEQRQLVQDVYDVQQAIIAELRPGARLSALGTLCNRLLHERGYKSLHGPCHHVGLAVHDKQGDVLVAGMVITVEPGAYLRDKAMGCRIEDTILITEDGSRSLSGDLPATPDAIETLMREPGLQQQKIGLPGQ